MNKSAGQTKTDITRFLQLFSAAVQRLSAVYNLSPIPMALFGRKPNIKTLLEINKMKRYCYI